MDIASLRINVDSTSLKKAERDLGRIGREADHTERAVVKMGKNGSAAMAGMKAFIAQAAAALSAAAFVQKLTQVQREFDVLNSSLITVTGGAKAAAREMQWIKDFAATTPYDLNQVTGAFVKMKALGLDPSQKALNSYGNTASAMGKDLNQMIEAVADAATGEFERLKEFGIKSRKQGDDVAFTFRGLTTTIRNDSDAITGYLQKLGENEFAGAMATRAKTLDGAISNLGDTWDEFYRTVNEAGAGKLIESSVRGATGAIKNLIDFVKNNTTFLIVFFSALIGAATLAGLAALASNIGLVTTAIRLLTIAMLANPATLFILALGAATAGLIAYSETQKSTTAGMQNEMMRLQSANNSMLNLKGYTGLSASERAEYDTNIAKINEYRAALQAASGPQGVGSDATRFDRAREQKEEADRLAAIAANQLKLGPIRQAAQEKESQYARDMADFAKAQDDYVQARHIKRLEEIDDLIKATQEQAAQELKAYTDSADGAEQSLQAMVDQQEAINLSKTAQISLARAVELTTIARLKERQIAAMANTDAVMAIQREIDARMKAIKMMEGSEAQQVLDDNEKAWKDSYQRIADSFVDAMIQGGDSIKTWLKNQFANLVLRPILAPIGGGVASLFGGSASAATGGGMGAALDVIGTVKNVYGTITGGFTQLGNSVAFAAQDMGAWLVNNTTGALNSAGSQLMSASGAIGTAASYAGGAAAGVALGRAISGGYSAFGKSGNTAVNAGTIIGSILGGPIGGAIGGAIGGLVNRTFGRKLKDFGVQGTFGGDAGFEGSQYQFLKGGFLRSDKTKYSALDAEVQAALAGQFNLIKTSVTNMGAALGLGAEALDSYTRAIKISTKGMTEAQVTEAWNKEFAAIGEEMAQRLLGTFETTTTSRFGGLASALIKGIFKNANLNLETTVTTWVAGPFIREGETAIDALARLSSSIVTVNPILDTLGVRMFEVSLAGADMASKLADAFGGLEAMGAATSAYYQAFYSETERTATATRQLTAVLAGMGLALPQTRDEFRSLVESQDLYTDAGRATYAALIQLAPAFDAIASVADQLAEELKSASSSVIEEIKRLRGLTAGGSLASLQAQFAIASGAARAGDAGALSQLPELSKAIEDAARLTARSSVDLALTRAWLASSMTETLGVLGMDVPAFANGGAYGGGLAMVGERGPELINFDRPGMVYSAAQTSSLMGGNSDGDAALVSEMRQLRSEVTMLRSEARATALNTGKTIRLLERVSRDGESLQVTTTDAP